LGLNKLASPIIIGVLLILAALTSSQFNVLAQEGNLPTLFAGSPDTGTKEVPLKGTRQNGEVTKVSDYKIDFNNVIQIGQGQYLVLFPEPSTEGFTVTKAKLVNEQKQIINLVPVSGQQNTFSLNGVANGVYTLQVVGRLGNTEGGYETVLVVPTLTEETRKVVQDRINQILLVEIYVEIIFEEPESPLPAECLYYPNLDQCKPLANGKCPAGYSMNEGGHCYPSSKKCPAGFWRADDDESGACVPKETPQPNPALCVDVFPPPPGCPSGGPQQGLVPIGEEPPLCDETTPPGQVCRDEGDLPPPEDNLAYDPNCQTTAEIGCLDVDEESASDDKDQPPVENEQPQEEPSDDNGNDDSGGGNEESSGDEEDASAE
jgi:hypothetical protein